MTTTASIGRSSARKLGAQLAHAAVLNPTNRPIVVGVDGHDGELPDGTAQAVRWAFREACLRGVDLHVVSAYEWRTALPWSFGSDAMIWAEFRTDATRSVRVALDITADEPLPHGSVRRADVHGEVLSGVSHRALDLVGRAAGTLVVGTRHLPGVVGTVTGSVSTMVASTAQCPVVVLCGEPPADTADSAPSPVVVGVSGDESTPAALHHALTYARQHGCAVRAVLVAHPMVADVREVRRDAKRWLAEALAGVPEQYPDVTVLPEVRVGHVLDELLSASADAQLLVVGRRALRKHPAAHFSAVSYRVLHHAVRPVAVVPATR